MPMILHSCNGFRTVEMAEGFSSTVIEKIYECDLRDDSWMSANTVKGLPRTGAQRCRAGPAEVAIVRENRFIDRIFLLISI
jgi:hypothetical protein